MLQILPKIHNIERTGRKRCRFWRWPAQLPLFRLLLPVAMGLTWAAQAAPGPVTQTGLPVQVVPTYPEVGAPAFSFPNGNGVGGGGSGSGAGGGSPTYTGCPGCDPLATMQAQSWGTGAVDAATTLGIDPAALAATCVVESGCMNTPAGSGGSRAARFR